MHKLIFRFVILTLLLLAVDRARAQAPATCRLEVRLDSIACSAANDLPDESPDEPTRGEYYLRVDNHEEVGPFLLKAGEGTSFAPGLLLKSIDTGVVRPDDQPELLMSVSFTVTAREDDSSPTGEDNTDDHSEPLEIRTQVACPGSTTLRRSIRILPNPNFEDGEQPDQIAVGIRITAR